MEKAHQPSDYVGPWGAASCPMYDTLTTHGQHLDRLQSATTRGHVLKILNLYNHLLSLTHATIRATAQAIQIDKKLGSEGGPLHLSFKSSYSIQLALKKVLIR